MKTSQSVRRRGQPLLALILLMVSWVGARAAMWEPPQVREEPAAMEARQPAPGSAAQRHDTTPARKRVTPHNGHAVPDHGPAPLPSIAPAARPVPEPTIAPQVPAPEPAKATVETGGPPPIAVTGAHQMLYSVGMNIPTVEDGVAADVPRRVLPSQAALIQPEDSPWSADAWLLLREGGNGYNAPGAGLPGVVVPVGFYGGSQAGLVLRYRLSQTSPLRPTLYLRAASGLQYPRGEEVALGLSVRPVRGVPVMLMGEGRVTRTTSGTIVRPAVAVVSEFPPVALPLGTRGEAYVQAGYVGGQQPTAFVDGQARVEKPVVRRGKLELRVGAGAWGGAQEGANRLDLGPTATLAVPIGPAGARLSADYRIRVAGQAAPGSGAVLTLSAGF